MEWTETLKRALAYLEDHLLEEDPAGGAAEAVYLSPFYLQKGFRLVTGYSMGEYIRYRRLYLAGLEVIAGRGKVIDLAYRYGYDTPESFSKAFRRFHGLSPAQLQRRPEKLVPFLPLKITLTIQGGEGMDFTVEKTESWQIIGVEKRFSTDSSYREIPKFWDSFCAAHCAPLWEGKKPETALERAISECGIGEYGVCIDDCGGGQFRYLIAGKYDGRPVPEGLEVFTFPPLEWAKFRCSGPLPESLQSVNTKIFQEWLPGNPEFEIAQGYNVEWYSMEKETSSPDYESGIWIPVRRKQTV